MRISDWSSDVCSSDLDLRFEAGEGPRLTPPLVETALDSLVRHPQRLDPVYAAVRGVAASLPAAPTLLGFAGSPWTVATYMVAGQGSRHQAEQRALAYSVRQSVR